MVVILTDEMNLWIWVSIAAGLILLAGWRYRRATRARSENTASLNPLPPSVSLHAQPLLTEEEAAFYNLLRLAVEDQYLVFTQIPVWCLVDIKSENRRARADCLNKIAFRRVDFALVHPGTLTVSKVIELVDSSQMPANKQVREHLLTSIFNEVGIEYVKLNAQTDYTVPALAALLGVEPTDES
ncbi:MAG: DUF2726 domain-containing protein [Nitrospiraceae bacterium]